MDIDNIKTYDYEVRLTLDPTIEERLAAVQGKKGGICEIGFVTNPERDGNCGFLEAAMISCILDQKRKGGFDPVKNKVLWRNHWTNKPLAKEAKKNCKTIIQIRLRNRPGDDSVMEMVDYAAHAMTAIKKLSHQIGPSKSWNPFKIIVDYSIGKSPGVPVGGVSGARYGTMIQVSDIFATLFIPLNGKNPRELNSPVENYRELFEHIGYHFYLCECQPAEGEYCRTMERGSDPHMERKMVEIRRNLAYVTTTSKHTTHA